MNVSTETTPGLTTEETEPAARSVAVAPAPPEAPAHSAPALSAPAPTAPAPRTEPVDAPTPRSEPVDAPSKVAPRRSTPAAPAPPSMPSAIIPTGHWIVPLMVLVTGMFMSVLDVSIVNVAIPAMQKEFGATTDDIQWVATSYSLALGVVVPASAWLGERVGLARAYILSLAFFGVGSALCGLAWNLDSMIVFRIVQAIPGGVIPVVALSMVYRIVPREKIGAAMGLYGLGIVFAPAVGPTLGGYLVEYENWRLIFFINVPIGILGAIAAVLLLPRFQGVRSGRFDYLGFVTIASSLFAFLLAVSEGPTWGWTGYRVLILFTYAILAMALFVVVELEVKHPMLDVRTFKYWAFTNSLILIAVLSVGLFGVLFFVPLFLQQTQGLGAFDTGLLLLPQAIVMGILMPIAGRIYDKIGPRWPALVGLTIMAIGTWWLHDITVDFSWSELRWVLAFRAIGMGLAMMPIMTGGLSAVPANRVSGASAFNNLTQRTTAAIGLAAMTAILTWTQTQDEADMGGLKGSLSSGAMSHPRTGSASGALSGTGSGGVSGLTAGGMPHGPGSGTALQQMQMSGQIQAHAFVTGMDDVMMVTTGLTVLGVILAMFLRHGPAPAQGPAVVEA